MRPRHLARIVAARVRKPRSSTINTMPANGASVTMTWLLASAPGFARLREDERAAIADFALLWPLFESRILNTAGSATSICAAVAAWQKKGDFDAATFDPELDYFRHRYVGPHGFTEHFDGLNLRLNDRAPLVRAVLDGHENDPANRVACVFIIILRFRNNLFHGVKWQYRLADQHENFATANSALMKALDLYGDLDHG